ncbi:hypothetical protein [Rossellomorea sp. DA94]|uniref:hypothetical protein n=1 Tax=Rossellomorea sp. DA94 TaxID=3038653 RepID=UPI00244802BC|nr:hypothetical protein [Rossellomorea sp. DA94]WGG47663.1 hypothetical protein P8596_10835 [Rossellomorea sp. DA94]
MGEKKDKLFVKVPTSIVRNEDIYISNDEFILYARLCFLHFRNYGREEMQVDHKKLMSFCLINDTRTFKKRLKALYEAKLILNEVNKLPTKGALPIEMNTDYFKEGVMFTKLAAEIFSYFNNGQTDTQSDSRIDEYAFRQIFYYKSHINTKMKDKKVDRSFCFVGYETLVERLRVSRTKIKEANEQLKKLKLVKVVKYQLGHDDQFNENDELVFDRYNNHYYVANSLF